ncbi:MAG TPA: glycosyltransferase [Chthoniobacterales bacterium]|jgi:glycosyltransferase involved in cell wall biosynthesis|nr:glycosyltransferase [Chthoniobacterales bacterium]
MTSELYPAIPSFRSLTTNVPQLPASSFPIIVHSHLGWDWVWQRPQQFHSHLSERHRILFVEGPVPRAGLTAARVSLRDVPDYPNIVIVQMEMPEQRWSDGAWVDKERRRLLQSVLNGPLAADFAEPVQWFYDPMAVTAFAGHLNESAIVYDCMDQLSQFRGAPVELVRRERELLAIADVVFAGGPKIWEEKRRYNANCYCFGCGVDGEHFAKASAAETVVPQDVAHLPKPVYGYIGVVDERLDYELIDQLAEDNAEGSVVMVGPWTKVERAALPERANLHWIGGRDYSQLPAYAKAFDVCLMPFALNEATEFINPTKALEYMATARPIVSSPIEDVVRQFSDVVSVARTAKEFAAACRRAATKPNRSAIQRGLKLAERNSWKSIVQRLEAHVLEITTRERSIATDAA